MTKKKATGGRLSLQERSQEDCYNFRQKGDQAVGGLRLKGYREALADNGIEVNKNLIRYMKDDIPEYSVANGYQVTKNCYSLKRNFLHFMLFLT